MHGKHNIKQALQKEYHIRDNIKMLYRFRRMEIIQEIPGLHWFTNAHRMPNFETGFMF